MEKSYYKSPIGILEIICENSKLVSKIERTFDRTFEKWESTMETEFGGGVHESGWLDKRHYFKDIVKDAEGNIIANRENYIRVPYVAAW